MTLKLLLSLVTPYRGQHFMKTQRQETVYVNEDQKRRFEKLFNKATVEANRGSFDNALEVRDFFEELVKLGEDNVDALIERIK